MRPWIAGLWRYPVKTLGGEPIEAAELTAAGIPGDRVVHAQRRCLKARQDPCRPSRQPGPTAMTASAAVIATILPGPD